MIALARVVPVVPAKPVATGVGEAVGGGGPTYDSDAVLWFAAVVANGGADPDAAFKQIVSDFYTGLKADGLYALVDRMGLMAAPDDISSRLDLKDKATLLTLSVPPTFTALRGYMGNAVNMFINTLFNSVSPAGNFTQNSCGLTTYINATASDVGSSASIIGRITSVISFFRPRTTGNVLEGRMGSGTTKQFGAVATRLGFRSVSRTLSNLTKGYGPDGTQVGTNDTSVSVALVNENFLLLRLQSVYASDRIAFWAAHAGFSDAQTLAFRNRIVTMLTAIGAN